MIWRLSWRNDPVARAIADRHYNRQSVEASGFVPPGRCLVLWTPGALWVTSWPFAAYVKHAWPGAWVCSAFRRESGVTIASDMIRHALAATRWQWAPPAVACPHCGVAVAMVTFVDRDRVRRKRDPGRCFVRAGFIRCRDTAGGLAALHIGAERLPDADAPLGAQQKLLDGEPR